MSRLLIIRTGSTAAEVRRIYGDYDRWFTGALSGWSLDFDIVDITREPFPDVTAHDGVIVTGATSAAYRHEPWMDPLSGFFRSVERSGVPTLAVCLGAQLLAQARGGKVIQNPLGWEIGAVEVDLSREAMRDPLFEGLPSRLRVLATHEDRVEELPAGAVLLASNTHSPVQAFRVGEAAWGVQFHPEICAGALEILIRQRGDRLDQDLRRRGEDETGLSHRLIAQLQRFRDGHGSRILDNFARICGRKKKKPLDHEVQRL